MTSQQSLSLEDIAVELTPHELDIISAGIGVKRASYRSGPKPTSFASSKAVKPIAFGTTKAAKPMAFNTKRVRTRTRLAS